MRSTIVAMIFVLAMASEAFASSSLKPELVDLVNKVKGNITLTLDGGKEIVFNPTVHAIKFTETKCRIDAASIVHIIKIDSIIAISFIATRDTNSSQRSRVMLRILKSIDD